MITKLTNISSKTPIAMLPDIVNHNNNMTKLEIYPDSVVNGDKTLPDGLKSLCNANGEIQRSINIDSDNTFKINHGEVTNDLNVYGKVLTNGVITKELTINEKLTINSKTLEDFIDKHRSSLLSGIINDNVINLKLLEALDKKDDNGKTIIVQKIDDYLSLGEDVLSDMVLKTVTNKFAEYMPEINNAISNALSGCTNSDIDALFTLTPQVNPIQK